MKSAHSHHPAIPHPPANTALTPHLRAPCLDPSFISSPIFPLPPIPLEPSSPLRSPQPPHFTQTLKIRANSLDTIHSFFHLHKSSPQGTKSPKTPLKDTLSVTFHPLVSFASNLKIRKTKTHEVAWKLKISNNTVRSLRRIHFEELTPKVKGVARGSHSAGTSVHKLQRSLA